MLNRDILTKAGIDYEKGLSRYLDDAEFYEEVLIGFEEEDAFERAEKYFEAGDANGLLNAVHELKGVAGNVEMTELYKSSSEVVALIRAGKTDMDSLKAPMERVRAAYLRAKEGLAQAAAN